LLFSLNLILNPAPPFCITGSGSLVQTSLSNDTPQKFGVYQSSSDEEVGPSIGKVKTDATKFDFSPIDLEKNEVRNRGRGSIPEIGSTDDINEFLDTIDGRTDGVAKPLVVSQNKNTAEGSVISFSGGGASTTYSYKRERTSTLDITLGNTYAGKAGVKASGSFGLFGVSWDTEASGGYQGNTGSSDTKNEESGESESVEFTLTDGDYGDFFDVEVLVDPLYGTPVFKTLAGRSQCPHELGTDAREAYDVVFPDPLFIGFDVELDQPNELDRSGSNIHNFVANVGRSNGTEYVDGACASFYIEIIDETPYGDWLSFDIKLVSPADGNLGEGAYDLSGFKLSYDSAELAPAFTGGEFGQRKKLRVGICPELKDDRVFVDRDNELRLIRTLAPEERGGNQGEQNSGLGYDVSGNEMNGWVFCNVEIQIRSACEFGCAGDGLIKGFGYQEDSKPSNMQMCDDYDIVNGPDRPSSASCYDAILPEIFDGDENSLTGPYKFAAERPLSKSILISCLSFDPDKNACHDKYEPVCQNQLREA
jgi:hypothetical protein